MVKSFESDNKITTITRRYGKYNFTYLKGKK